MFGADSNSNLRLRPRESTKNPRSAHCKIAHRRICGVCQHFDGAMAGKGTCTHLGLTKRSGLRSAAECIYWGRRSK